jgi:hypothetical protein
MPGRSITLMDIRNLLRHLQTTSNLVMTPRIWAIPQVRVRPRVTGAHTSHA